MVNKETGRESESGKRGSQGEGVEGDGRNSEMKWGVKKECLSACKNLNRSEESSENFQSKLFSKKGLKI